MEFIFNFFKGFISIEITGFSVTRFLNLCSNKNIFLWDIKYCGSKVFCKTYIKNFYSMHIIAKKTGCKIKVEKKTGLPFLSFKYRKRKILFFGSVVFVATVYLLSTYIWYIDISGTTTINDFEIIDVLNLNNVYVGKSNKKIDTKQLEKELQKEFPTITWVSIYKKGTTLNIDISESISKEFEIAEEKFSHIVAKKEGVVVYTKTSKGDQLVNIGDVVKKGEVLVSGEILLSEDANGKNYRYIDSISEIYAETMYDFNFEIDKNLIIKNPTGKTKSNFKINLLNKTYDFFKPNVKYDNYDKITYRTQLKLSEKYLLPIVIIKEEYIENNVTKRLKTDKEIKEESETIVNNIVNSKLKIGVDIINKEINLKKTSQNIEVYSIIYVIENIGEKEIFEPVLENTEDDIEAEDT